MIDYFPIHYKNGVPHERYTVFSVKYQIISTGTNFLSFM